MIKNRFIGLGFTIVASASLLVACGQASKNVHTVTFYDGTNVLETKTVNDGETVETFTPSKAGYTFVAWYEDSVLVTLFDAKTQIESDYDLFAKWNKSSGGGSSSESTTTTSEDTSTGGQTTSESSTNPHGPDGSTEVDWYIAGSGSLWDADDWSLNDAVRLFSNPGNTEDLGCILDITFEADDIFKVTNGTTWYGYEKVDQSEGENNKGKTNFIGENDNMGGQNIKCTVSGKYNIYVNKDGKFWIESAN